MKILAAVLLFSACATVKPAPTPKLADVQTMTVGAHFLGRVYDPGELYVCSGLGGDFACVTYVDFMGAVAK